MSSATHDAHANHPAHDAGGGHAHDEAHARLNPAHYGKIARLLIILAIISGLGPEIAGVIAKAGAEHVAKYLMLGTAFGIAVYKAYLVATNFMHLHIERRFVVYLLSTALAFMFLFFAGASLDVKNHRGRNWENVAAQGETARAEREHAAHPEHEE